MRNAVPLVAIGCVTAIILGIIVAGVVMIGYGISGYLSKSSESSHQKNDPNQPPKINDPKKQSLMDARKGHNWTRLPVEFKDPIKGAPVPVLDANVVKFESPAGELSAYLSNTKNPEREIISPPSSGPTAGFGGIRGQSIGTWPRHFHDAGFVLMIPSFRHENSNPGNFEMFYGEVDDLLAAIAYVASQPNVDPSRVYVAGHDNGGTLALLAAVMGADAPGSNKVRAFFSNAGIHDVQKFFSLNKNYQWQEPPFISQAGNGSSYLRSASPFVGAMRRPTFYFGARTDEKECAEAVEMVLNAEGRAEGQRPPFHAFIAGANHDTIVNATIRRICDKIKTDVGLNCNIDFSLDHDLTNLGK